MTYFFDADGYPTAVLDDFKNGHGVTFTLEDAVDAPGELKKRVKEVVADGGQRKF